MEVIGLTTVKVALLLAVQVAVEQQLKLDKQILVADLAVVVHQTSLQQELGVQE